MPGAVQKLAQWEPVVYVLSFAFFPHSTHRAPRNESFQLYRSQRHLFLILLREFTIKPAGLGYQITQRQGLSALRTILARMRER